MANNAARIAAIGVTAVMALGVGSAAASDTGPTVVARVENLSAAREADVLRAQTVATELYQNIGVSLVWIGRSDEVPRGHANAIQLRVALLSEERLEQLLDTHRISEGVLGLAPHDVPVVYIFCGRIEQKAAKANRPFDATLGRVLAHEIGHQLLPGQGHSRTGIMRANLQVGAGITMGFTHKQRESIHALLGHAR